MCACIREMVQLYLHDLSKISRYVAARYIYFLQMYKITLPVFPHWFQFTGEKVVPASTLPLSKLESLKDRLRAFVSFARSDRDMLSKTDLLLLTNGQSQPTCSTDLLGLLCKL